MYNRLKQIREYKKTSQAKFAKLLGMGQSTLGMMEVGKREILDRHIKTICSVCDVNEDWLRTGNGDMFVRNENEDIARLADEYNLDALSYKIMESYLRLGEEQQRVIRRFIAETAEQDAASATYENELQPAQKDLSAKEQAALLRARADAIEKGSAESTIIERDA